MSGRHQPLRQADQIRLLELQPGSREDPICCRLLVAQIPSPASILSTVQYEALSYVWGEDIPDSEIVIDGWPFRVRENLWHFLIRMRHPTERHALWIDALCVDQANVKERSSQVQSMGAIYRAAGKVLVWLGPAFPDSDLAMDAIRDAGLSQDLPASVGEEAVCNALQRWGTLAYWSRTWIVQEFLHARDVVLVCGTKQVDWRSALRLCDKLTAHKSHVHGQDYTRFLMSPASALLNQRMKGISGQTSLAKLLIDNQHSNCLEPRDRIYALLSLASDCVPGHTITVDYSKNVRALFYDVMSFCKMSDRETMRFGQLLVRLLQIDTLDNNIAFSSSTSPGPQTVVSFSESLRSAKTKEPKLLGVTMFNTGYVICNDVLRGSSATALALNTQPSSDYRYGGLSTPSRTLEVLEAEEASEMMKQLEGVDLQRLVGPLNSLQAISRRSWNQANTQENLPPKTPHALSLVVVYFSQRSSKTFAIGLAFGSVCKGDKIIQTPGYETSFAVRSSNTHSNRLSHISGRVLCARQGKSWVDPLTSKVMDFNALMNEAELSPPSPPITLLMTPNELLSLLR